ncbi:MAG: HAD family hydrolase [Bdellovibrionaceae bacterium]|nr:HAD family hydrolase [Pseudobdellovibrionaceae bacterium]
MKLDKYKAILLDVDGTLIDSNQAHALAWRDAFLEFGLAVGENTIRKKIGMGGDHLLPSVIGLSNETPLGKKIEKRRGEIFRSTYLPNLKAFPRAAEMLKFLRSTGKKLIVATSASEKDYEALMKQAGLSELVDGVTNSADAESSKPDPDIILAALKKSKVNHDEALMIGDTPYDVSASNKATVDIVAFTCGGWSVSELTGSISVYEGPGALLDKLQTERPTLGS